MKRRGTAGAVLIGALVGVGVWAAPRPSAACPPSGLAGEVLVLSLDSVRVAGVGVDTIPYGVAVARIEGVGSSFALYVEFDGGHVRGEFVK